MDYAVEQLLNMRFYTKHNRRLIYTITSIPGGGKGPITIEWYKGQVRKISTHYSAGAAIIFFKNNDWIETKEK